ncbi:MAG: phospholipase D-like domain-containing protein [Cyanobacteria bacterium P01_F01_bin.150]
MARLSRQVRENARQTNLGWQCGTLIVALTALGLGTALYYQNNGADITLAPLPQNQHIQAYFNYSQASHYQEPYRKQHRPGDNLEQIILDHINQANISIDLAIQELNLPQVAQALLAKHQEGLKVRVIVEHDYRQPWSALTQSEIGALKERDRHKYDEFLQLADLNNDGTIQAHEALQRDAMRILELGQVPLIDDTADGSKGSGLMHHKFMVVDNQVVITGSANFTTSGIHGDVLNPKSLGNANHLIVIDHDAIVQLLTDEFQLMWGDGPGRKLDSLFGLQKPYRPPQTISISADSSVTVQFSPVSADRHPWQNSTNGLINRTIQSAEESIDLALFVFSEQPLSQTLQERHKQNVAIRALIDSGFIYRNYSEALDMMGVARLDKRCQVDTANAPWVPGITTVGTPQLAEGDKLHHKFAIIDQTKIVTGSQNWSKNANHKNDEAVIILNNKKVAAHFSREFEQLYGHANFGVPRWLQLDIQSHKTRCSKS